MNWTSTGFTPTGGSLQAVSRVSGIDIDPGGQLLEYSGDGNRFPVAIFNHMNKPSFTINSENIGVLSSLAPGAVGVVSSILNDPKNGAGAGSGAILFALANAVLENPKMGGKHMAYATGSATFKGYSSDGVTSPLTATPQ